MTIWVFGDSYSRYFKSQPDTWVARTARILNHKVIAYSRPLEPLEHLFYKFNEKRSNIKENDIIIFTLTNLDRRWFWKDQIFKVHYEYTDIETISVNEYQKYLNFFNQLHLVYLTNFMYNLESVTKKLNLHTIVISNFKDYDEFFNNIEIRFPYFHFAQGILADVSDLEWKTEIIEEKLRTRDYREKRDKRLNHLSKSNQIILSDKIIANIQNKEIINLRKGFNTDFMTYELEEDKQFRETELYNDEWINTVNSDNWKRDEE